MSTTTEPVNQQSIKEDVIPPVAKIEAQVQGPSSTTTSYTLAQVAEHNTKDDCWMILDNGVYDVTSFIPDHPGGDKILRGCGKDATEMFTQHPESAKAMKEKFKI